MKKICTALLLFLLAAAPLLAYTVTPQMNGLDYAATNTFIVDATAADEFALSISFTGVGSSGTVAALGLTNNPVNAAALGLTVGADTTVYTWATNPVTTVTTYASPGTNLIIGFTNGTAIGDALVVTLNATQRTFTFTNSPVLGTDVLTNTTAAGSATNFYNAAAVYWPTPQISIAGALVTIKSGVGSAWQITDAAGVTTNSQTAYYTVTNVAPYNSHQVALAASAASAATNLAAVLAADYAGILTVTQPSATGLRLATVNAPGLLITNTASWTTNLITTNAIAGNLIFVAQKSLDQLTWFSDAARSFTVAYSGTTAVTHQTNYSTLGALGYWRYRVENAPANYARPQPLEIKSAVK